MSTGGERNPVGVHSEGAGSLFCKVVLGTTGSITRGTALPGTAPGAVMPTKANLDVHGT